jgi:hypothetical protein
LSAKGFRPRLRAARAPCARRSTTGPATRARPLPRGPARPPRPGPRAAARSGPPPRRPLAPPARAPHRPAARARGSRPACGATGRDARRVRVVVAERTRGVTHPFAGHHADVHAGGEGARTGASGPRGTRPRRSPWRSSPTGRWHGRPTPPCHAASRVRATPPVASVVGRTHRKPHWVRPMHPTPHWGTTGWAVGRPARWAPIPSMPATTVCRRALMLPTASAGALSVTASLPSLTSVCSSSLSAAARSSRRRLRCGGPCHRQRVPTRHDPRRGRDPQVTVEHRDRTVVAAEPARGAITPLESP